MREGILVRLQLLPFFMAFFLHALWYACRVDVIHCHWPPAGLVGTIVGKYLCHKPVVLTMHHGSTKVPRLQQAVLRWILRKVDYLLANSTFTLQRAREIAEPRGHDIMPPGVDTDFFSPRVRMREFYDELGLQADRPLILSVGRLIPWKGFRYLIEAIGILAKQMGRRDIQALIVGAGPLRDSLECLVASADLKSNIKFISPVARERTPILFSHADIVVAPSIIDEEGNTEGLGLTLLEANACCVPCIGSRVGGIVDIIETGKNGILVEQKDPKSLAEQVDFLLNHPEKRREMGHAGRLKVRDEYASSVLSGRLLCLYTNLLGARAGNERAIA